MLSKVIVPALIAPVLAGLVALGATVIVYRLIKQLRAGARRARLPLGAGRVVVDGRARARHQRRAEDDGRHLPGADRQRQPLRRRHFDVPTWVVVSLRHGDRARHLHRRLADHQDARHEGHRGAPAAGLLLRGGRRDGDPRLLALRLPAVDDARRLGRGHRLRRRPAGRVGRLVGRRGGSSPAGCSRCPRRGSPPRSSTASRRSSAQPARRADRGHDHPRDRLLLPVAANKASKVDPNESVLPNSVSSPNLDWRWCA